MKTVSINNFHRGKVKNKNYINILYNLLLFYTCELAVLFVSVLGVKYVLICQPQTAQYTLRCPPGDEILIDTVFYGRNSLTTCNPTQQAFNNIQCVGGANSNTMVHMYCDHQASCIVKAENSFLGVVDPCPGIPKYLQVFIVAFYDQ